MAEEKTLKQIIDNSEEFLRKKVKWYNKRKKATTKNPNPKDCWLAYVDARPLEDYLDLHIKPQNWQVRYSEVRGSLFCEVGIFWDDVWIWKGNNGADSAIEAEKGAASDAFKRACFRWGFGRFLYDDKKKPVRGGGMYSEKGTVKDDLKKAQIAVAIMEFETDLPAQIEETLNFISSKGYSTLNDCSLELLELILTKLESKKEETINALTDGFNSTEK